MDHLGKMGALVALVLVLTTPASSAGNGFECPVSIEGTTPEKRAEIQKLLPPGNAIDDPSRLNASVDALRSLGLSKSTIVNHMIGAYCPSVASDASLSFAEKTAKVRRFAERITVLVDDVENESGVFVNVLLKPDVVDEITAKAQSDGLSVQDWLSKIISAAAKRP